LEYRTHTNPIGKRLKSQMQKHGINSTELARRSGVLTSFLYDIISGKSSNPSTVKLARVADALGVSLNYLVGSDADFSGEKGVSNDNYVTIPRILVSASAGGGSIVSHEEEGEVYYFRKEWIRGHLGANSADLRMLTISGDSMNPTLAHNDMVLIDTSKKHPSPPSIFVLFDGFGLVAKRCEYIETTGKIRLSSDNPSYAAYERGADEVVIVGRVVWFAREI